jgi:hypothetical protein
MANVFFSYSRSDRSIVEPLIKAIEKQGYSVWWDSGIRSGSVFRRTIALQLAAAQCVVVAWSQSSIQSNWVIDEAEYAGKQDKLLPILIADCLPPMGLRQIQTENLAASLDTLSGDSWERFLGDLKDCIAKAQLKGLTGKVDETARAEAKVIRKGAAIRMATVLALISCLAILAVAATWFGYAYPYRVAAIVSPEVRDDLDAMRYGSNFPDIFRRTEKWISRGDKYRIVASIGTDRLAEIISFGHRANSDNGIFTVLQYVADSAASDLSLLGASFDAVDHVKSHAAGVALAKAGQIETKLLDLVAGNRTAAPACQGSCAQEWLYVPAPAPSAGLPNQQPVAAFCLSRADTTVEDYRVFDSTFAPTLAEIEPARGISWLEAISYAKWRQARLPALGELQYALKLSGLDISRDGIFASAWLLSNSADTVQPVATRTADKLGLKDLIGDVYEWTGTWTPSSESDQTAFTGTKVIFGASYQTDKAALDLSLLNFESPFARRAYVGIRLARAPTKAGDCNFSQSP